MRQNRAGSYTNPTTFAETKFGGSGLGGGYARRMDYDAFMGAGSYNAMRGNVGNFRAAGRAAGILGGIGRASQPLSKTFNLMGRNVTYGRAGMTAGLGLLAARNGANMMDRMRYGDYGGAMMSGALTAAAGYGAYSTWMYKGALRSHFNNAAAWILKRFR